MELIYAGLLLHSAKKEISEENIEKVVAAAGIKTDKAMIKALVASLEGVNIDEAIKQPVAPVQPQPQQPAQPTEDKKKEEDKKKTEEAVEGLSSLFG